MSSERDTLDHLYDMLENAKEARRFIEGMSFEQFENDRRTIYAVLQALQIMGEAAKKISDTVRSEHPSVPWREMAGMRDKLIHGYFDVNLSVVWRTVNEVLPAIEPQIARAIEEETRRESTSDD